MSHDYHESLAGYDERNVWHDGCAECEERAASGLDGLDTLDEGRRLLAWQMMRAYRWDSDDAVWISQATWRLLNTLYLVAVFIERAGIKPDEFERRLGTTTEDLLTRFAAYVDRRPMDEPATVLPQYDATNSVRLCDRCEQESGVSAGADAGDCACAVCGCHHAPHVYVALVPRRKHSPREEP